MSKPEHVKNYYENITYPEYTEEEKKRGMNEKDMDFMADNPMFYAVFLPSLFTIGMGIIPFVVMFIFFEKADLLDDLPPFTTCFFALLLPFLQIHVFQ